MGVTTPFRIFYHAVTRRNTSIKDKYKREVTLTHCKKKQREVRKTSEIKIIYI